MRSMRGILFKSARVRFPTSLSDARQARKKLGEFLFSFKGRAGNFAYILYQAALFPVLYFYFHVQGHSDADIEALNGVEFILLACLGVFIIWTYTAVLAKRLHDVGLSIL